MSPSQARLQQALVAVCHRPPAGSHHRGRGSAGDRRLGQLLRRRSSGAGQPQPPRPPLTFPSSLPAAAQPGPPPPHSPGGTPVPSIEPRSEQVRGAAPAATAPAALPLAALRAGGSGRCLSSGRAPPLGSAPSLPAHRKARGAATPAPGEPLTSRAAAAAPEESRPPPPPPPWCRSTPCAAAPPLSSRSR